MNKQIRLLGVILFSLLMVGVLLGTVHMASAAPKTPPTTDKATPILAQPAATLATTLTISISDVVVLAVDGLTKTMDLSSCTYYDDDPAALVYTATNLSAPGILDVDVVGHQLIMTVVTTSPNTGTVNILVSDGVLTATTDFLVHVDLPPEIEFLFGVDELPNPFEIYAGTGDLLRFASSGGGYGAPADLERYSGDMGTPTKTLTYSIVSTPISLGVSIVVSTVAGSACGENCHYVWIEPDPGTVGTFPVTVQVQDTYGLTATDVFTVSAQPTTTVATTLTLSISDVVVLAVDGLTKTIDLLSYTNYDGNPAALVYTATDLSDPWTLDVGVVGHQLIITVETSYVSTGTVNILVSDGVLTATTDFLVYIDLPPEIDFDFGVDELPDPFEIYAGTGDFLRFVSGYGGYRDPADLERYSGDIGTPRSALTYSIVSTPISLGVSIVISTVTGSFCGENCHYVWIEPDPSMAGLFPVTVQVRDTHGLTATDVFTVNVFQRVFLPVVLRTYPLVPILHVVDNPDGDGDYTLEWHTPDAPDSVWYDIEYALNPDFTDAVRDTTHNTSYSFYNITPGVRYWRVRVQADYDEAPFPWSNVQAVNVGEFAYLYVEPLCAFNTRVELFGANQYVGTFDNSDCINFQYWRSVPVGTYTTRITWVGGSIVENVPAFAFGNAEYELNTHNYPGSQWQPH